MRERWPDVSLSFRIYVAGYFGAVGKTPNFPLSCNEPQRTKPAASFSANAPDLHRHRWHLVCIYCSPARACRCGAVRRALP